MKVTVLTEGRTVQVDGDPRVVANDTVMPKCEVLQWFGKRGWLEFPMDEEGRKPENEEFLNFEPYQYLVEAHAAAKARDDAAQAKAKAAAQAARDAIKAEADAIVEADRVARGE